MYLGGERQNRQAACQNSTYLKDLMPRRNHRCSSPCTAVQSQGVRGRLPSSQTPVTTESVKDSRIDVRGNPTPTANKPKVTPFNNTSCYIRPNYQQANSLWGLANSQFYWYHEASSYSRMEQLHYIFSIVYASSGIGAGILGSLKVWGKVKSTQVRR